MNWPLSRLVAHRANHEQPNTIEGIRRAYALGIRTVELDLHLTSDDLAVVRHDEDVGKEKVWRFPLMSLCADGHGENFFQVCQVLSELGMSLVADLKIPHHRVDVTVPRLVNAVLLEAWRHKVPCVIASFCPDVAAYLGGAVMGSPQGLAGTCVIYGKDVNPANASGYMLPEDSELMTADVVAVMNSRQRFMGAYGVHGVGRARALLDMGVDFVVMDRPELLLA